MDDNSNSHTVLKGFQIQKQSQIQQFTCTTQKAKSSYSAKELEQALIQFDLDEFKYGPAIGITRYVRYQRAKQYGIQTPEILDIAIQKDPNSMTIQSHWLQ